MVGTWLLELYLDQVNRSLLEVEGQNGRGREQKGATALASKEEASGQNGATATGQLTQELRAFLKRNVDVLDVNVTVSLLAGYGRLEDLMEYATYRKVSIAACCAV